MDRGQQDNTQGSWPGPTGAPQPPPPPPVCQPPPPEGHYASAPPPPPRRGTNWALVIGLVLAALVLLGGMMLVAFGAIALWSGGEDFSGFGERVGVITIEGAISASGEQSLLGPVIGGVRATMEQLRNAAKDDAIKAVVLRINSPGGSAAASQELYQEVKRLSDTKPVVVSMADVAASGGYYIAAPADRIVANGSSVTGSIGVRMEYLHFYELMERYGMGAGNLTTGPYKDTGSPFRPMREDERKLLQTMLDDMYQQFVAAVAEGRDMDPAEVRRLADGRVYTGEQALEAGLIDEIGNFYRAVEIAGELGGIEGEPKIKEIRGGGGLWSWMGAMERHSARRVLEYLLYDERLEDVDSLMRLPE